MLQCHYIHWVCPLQNWSASETTLTAAACGIDLILLRVPRQIPVFSMDVYVRLNTMFATVGRYIFRRLIALLSWISNNDDDFGSQCCRTNWARNRIRITQTLIVSIEMTSAWTGFGSQRSWRRATTTTKESSTATWFVSSNQPKRNAGARKRLPSRATGCPARLRSRSNYFLHSDK